MPAGIAMGCDPPFDEIAIGRARANFPGAESAIYADVAAQGLVSRQAYEAADRISRSQMEGRATSADWQPILDSARSAFARLIGASLDEVAVARSVSDGLNTLLNALPWQSGDNVVFCPQIEHQNGIAAMLNLRRHGVTVRSVPLDGDMVNARLIADAMDQRTKLVFASSVSFVPGFRSDLALIGSVCRQRGAFLLVDAAQSLGVLPTDVTASMIDGLAASSGKGMLGLIGTGFLYCRAAWIDRLHPAYLSAQGVTAPLTGDMAVDEMSGLRVDAQRFQMGSPSWTAIASVEAALRQILEIGQQNIERHCLALARRLAARLEHFGLPVRRAPDERLSSHIVTVGSRQASPDGVLSDPILDGIAQHLRRDNVRFSVRRGMLRFAFHVYNNEEDIDRLIELCRAGLGR